MSRIIKNIIWWTGILFSILYFFTPFGGRLNNVYQSILPGNWNTISTWDSQIITWNSQIITWEHTSTWNTWSNITILTWDISLTWENETWIVKIPESPRDYLNYLLEHWVAWTDYIIANPPKPPVIYSSNKEENNAIKDAYLARTKVTFTLPETDKQGYVLFVADREIPDNRDIFLAINGQSLWAIRKNKSLPVAEYGEYLYPMDKVVIAGGNGRARNLYDYVNNNELWLNAFVWEKGNYTKKIIIFFK